MENKYKFTLFVYHENEWVAVADGNTVMDTATFMTELQLAGYAPDDMYAIDTITGEIVMEGALIKS